MHTLPLDHIYGLMGLVEEEFILDVDYTLSLRDLLAQVVKKHMDYYLCKSKWDSVAPLICSWNVCA